MHNLQGAAINKDSLKEYAKLGKITDELVLSIVLHTPTGKKVLHEESIISGYGFQKFIIKFPLWKIIGIKLGLLSND